MFNVFVICLMAIYERMKFSKIKTSPHWGYFGHSVLPVITAGVLMAIGIYGFLNVLICLPQESIGQYLLLGIKGRWRSYIPWGQGFTILHVAPQIAVILSMVLIRKRIWKIVIMMISLGVVTAYSFIYMARIMLMAPLIAILILGIRKKFYPARIPRRIVIMFVVLLIFLNVLQQGFRDYEVMGQEYTKSVIKWGFSRMAEYYIATCVFSAYICSFAGTIEPLPPRFYFGTPEYTNMGSLGQLWNSFGIAYPLVLLGIWYLVSKYWQRFDKGYTDGLIVFPFLFYSLLEVPRIFEFTTVTGGVRLGLLVFCGWLFRNVCVPGVLHIKR